MVYNRAENYYLEGMYGIQISFENHLFGAVETGVYAAFDGQRIVGICYVYKRMTEYEGEELYIGGIGGLAVAPEYSGRGRARKLVECALQKSYEIGVDVACLFTEKTETVYKLYEKFGYAYLNRDACYVDSLGKERTRDDVMILGLRNKSLAEKILTTDGRFSYGKEEGCW